LCNVSFEIIVPHPLKLAYHKSDAVDAHASMAKILPMLSLTTSRLIFVSAAACLHMTLIAGDAKPPAISASAPVVMPEPPAPKEFLRPTGLVSTEMLAKLIKDADPKFVIIDSRSRDAFDEGHITGARSLPSDPLQDPQAPPFYLVSADKLKQLCTDAGISADSRVIIYDADDGRLSARVWFTLHAYGHDNVAILDGGIEKWKSENRMIATDASPATAKGSFEPAATLRGVAAFADLAQFRMRVHNLGQLPTTTLLDARSTPEYMGEETRGKHAGHVPGAANVEWSGFMSGKERARVWRTASEIHAILRVGGVDREQKMCVYDQSGGRSSHLYFTLWLMGFDKVFNYTAGWREYGNRDDVEVEK
jgi:thiosulfate/3-mercaptopyruvate sulfurtransferase